MTREVGVGGFEGVAPFAVRRVSAEEEEEALTPDGAGGSVATVGLAIATAVIVPVAVPVGAEGKLVVVDVVVLTLAVVAVFGVERSSDDVRSLPLPLIDWSSLISTITPCRGRVAVGASATGSGRGCSCSPPLAL